MNNYVFADFIDVQTPVNHSQTLHRAKAFFFVCVCVWVIRRNLHIDKIHKNKFPSADSKRAVVNFWRKNVHNTG